MSSILRSVRFLTRVRRVQNVIPCVTTPQLARSISTQSITTASQRRPRTSLSSSSASSFSSSTQSKTNMHTLCTATSLLPSSTTTSTSIVSRARWNSILQGSSGVRRLSKLSSSVTRNPDFNPVTDDDIAQFRTMLGDGGVLTDPDDIAPFNSDWLGNWGGATRVVLRPKTTEQVSAVLKYCNEHKLGVVPQSGNTGLVGGSVPLFDEVVISMTLMNEIGEFDDVAGIVACQSGVVLEHLNSFLESKGYIMPLDLGAKGSCLVGGNAATNAGGIRYIRYGSLHGSILGLEAVLPDGTILDSMSMLRKDNTGYDLKQLFIGSEGTLGIITKLAILAPRKPKAVHVAYLGVKDYDAVLETMKEARADLGEILSAVEFQDRTSLQYVVDHLPGARDPLDSEFPFYVLIETSGSNAEHDSEKLSAFLERVMEEGVVLDGTLAQDETQIRSLWQLREGIAESLIKAGTVYKYDVSLPVTLMYKLVTDLQARFKEHNVDGAVACGYGHLGDSNLHLNIVVPEHSEETHSIIEPWVFEQVAAVRGSVSAEHGVGQCKVDYLHFSKSDAMIETMRRVKNLFDPNGIMNPYKVLPAKK
jgi:(R)-2-hydroxyglutarate---pyruvate transhydrogenase